MLHIKDAEEPVKLGYQSYLRFRKFAGDNLLHVHEEVIVNKNNVV